MEPASNPDLTSTAPQYAKPDAADSGEFKERIVACLRDCDPGFQRLHVTVFGRTVVLRGELHSRKEKRACLECCRNVPGVLRVIDALFVADEMPLAPPDPE